MEKAQQGRGVGWLCDWKGVSRVADMKAQGVRFEAVERAVPGGYLQWEGEAGSGNGEPEVREEAATGGEEPEEEGALLPGQPFVALGVEQGKDGDLARVYVQLSSEGVPAGRAEEEQPCSRKYHKTLRAAEMCAKAASEGQECR